MRGRGRARSGADRQRTYSARVAGAVADHTVAVVVGAVLLTAGLAVPLLTMTPDEAASVEPSGPMFEASETIEERFGADAVGWFFIVEARDGELLDRSGLLAVHERLETLRTDPTLAGTLAGRTDPRSGERLLGTVSLVDAVEGALSEAGGLAGADDGTVRTAVSAIIDEQGPGELGLSSKAVRDPESGWWSAPALTLDLRGDGSRIEGRAEAGFASDVGVERTGREVQTVLRETPDLDVWGVALDQTLTAEEQGQAAGPFIGMTVLVIVLLVGAAFGSYWTLAVVGGALVALLVWLLGLANLVGLKEDQILATVVPIAMIAFGVDYAFHAVGRWREERSLGAAPRPALARGLAGVAPALLLAFATGVVAFLANSASGIESIVQFGIGAAIALSAAFVVLGVVVPAALTIIETRVPRQRPPGGRLTTVAGSVAAAATAMTAVLFTVYLAPAVGIGLLGVYVLAFVVLPAWLASRSAVDGSPPARGAVGERAGGGRAGAVLASLVAGVASRRSVVLPAVALVTAGAAYAAVQVPTSFDVEDFFAPSTDFVVALDALDEHVGEQSGEPASVLVLGDLTEPGARGAVDDAVERLAALESPLLARDTSGQVRVDTTALSVVDGTSALSPEEAAQFVVPAEDGAPMAAVLGLGLVGSRAQENVEAARDVLDPVVSDLDAELAALQPGAGATLTGAPILRQASLDAVSRSLAVSLPVAVVLCLLCAWVFMRSLRYALVSIAPILVVVAWLYGFMYVAGFSVNLVTATIGAISIGIGIDFATHMTVRFREELGARGTRLDALRAATSSTGMALAGSAATSVAGFAILALAPMPMFASFGLLTAVMIVLALAASLLVLPGLLLLVTREPGDEPAASEPPIPPAPRLTRRRSVSRVGAGPPPPPPGAPRGDRRAPRTARG